MGSLLGAFVNALAVIFGGFLGMSAKNIIKEENTKTIMQALAVCIMLLGISTSITQLMRPDVNVVLFILCIVIGCVVGEMLNIEGALHKFGGFVEGKAMLLPMFKNSKNIAKAFVMTSILYCVGTMAILGPLESGIKGDHTIQFAKSVLDGVSSIVFASTLGVGVVFSAATIFVYQGAITIFAKFISPYLTVEMLDYMSLIGGVLIVFMAFNILGIVKAKTGNMLPAILMPVLYFLVVGR